MKWRNAQAQIYRLIAIWIEGFIIASLTPLSKQVLDYAGLLGDDLYLRAKGHRA